MRKLLAALLIALLPAYAAAQTERDYGDLTETVVPSVDSQSVAGAALKTSAEGEKAGQPASGIELLVDKVFQRKFYRALALARSGNFDSAQSNLNEIKQIALEQGYSNLSEYSTELVRAAQTASASGNRDIATMLLEYASELSPTHPRVQLLVASFWDLLGPDDALSHVNAAFSNMWSYPIFRWTLTLNVMILGLLGMTLALSITCVVQILRNGEQIALELGRRFPRHLRGLMGPVTLATAILAPIYLGVLGMLAVWSLALSVSSRGCRSLSWVTGLLLIVWGVAVPFIVEMGESTGDHLNGIFEEVHAGNYVPAEEDFLLDQLSKNPDDPYVLFAVAQSLHRKGLTFEAQGVYQKVTEVVKENTPLHFASLLNLGVINLQDGRLKDARDLFELLERRKYKSFELFYNLALIHLALLDTAKHRMYYELAKSDDKARLDRLVIGGLEEAQPLVGAPPASIYTNRLFSSVKSASPDRKQRDRARVESICAATMRYGSPTLFVLLGVAMVLAGGYLSFTWSRPQRKRPTMSFELAAPSEGTVSRLWSLIPAGMFLAGERPVVGSMVVALFLMLTFSALDAPVQLFPILPVAVTFQGMLLTCAFTLALASCVAALWFTQRPVNE